MKENETIIELTNAMDDQATEERIAWLEHEQQKNDLECSSWLGISVLVGVLIWIAIYV